MLAIAPRPLYFGKSLLFFGIPAVLMALLFWKGMPLLDWLGWPLLKTCWVGFGFASIVLLRASHFFFRREGNAFRWSVLRERFRLHPLDAKAWVWTLFLTGILFLSSWLLGGTAEWINRHIVDAPKFWMRVHENIPGYFLEIPIRGSWWAFCVYSALLVLQIFSEELWFRGYIFPRQELAYGRFAWTIHAPLWLLFRAVLPSQLIQDIAGSLLLPYLSQRLSNTWPAILSRSLVCLVPVLLRSWYGN